MRALGRVTIATLAAGALISTVGVGGALAFQPVSFTYDVTNLAPGTHFQAVYSGGADQGLGGSAQAGTGEISYAGLFPNGVVLFPQPSGAPLTADVQQWVQVANCTLQGDATVPAGTTVTLTNNTTSQQVTVNNGRFQIATGMCGLGAAPRKSRSQTITCKGSARSCRATVPLAGGASNRKLVIRLTDTNLRLRSITAVPRRSRSAYLLTGGHYRLRGSEYVITLNAVRSNPKGSHLTLTFG
jgi:hypothetical protein